MYCLRPDKRYVAVTVYVCSHKETRSVRARVRVALRAAGTTSVSPLHARVEGFIRAQCSPDMPIHASPNPFTVHSTSASGEMANRVSLCMACGHKGEYGVCIFDVISHPNTTLRPF